MVDHGMSEAVTYTDTANTKLKNLYVKHGYHWIEAGNNFIRLSKSIGSSAPSANDGG